MEQIDNLRYSWQQLQATALASHVQLLKMQPQFEDDLKNNLDKFRDDNTDYCHEYRYAGPMQPGLSPREASDRLILFQVKYCYNMKLSYPTTYLTSSCTLYHSIQ